jgi:predicted unusual protein kinase regulating ubiquinone biosynthesis (AarF/ABC1/UbiB family)
MLNILIIIFIATFLSYEKIISFFHFTKLLYYIIKFYTLHKFNFNISINLIENLYFEINKNGYFSIKFIQWLLTRCKMMYTENNMPVWVKKFDDFYENCEEHEFSYTKTVLENHFNKPILEIFKKIDKKSLASGSIAQVHRCIYKDSEKECILKIKHPNLEKNSYFCRKFMRIFEFILKTRFHIFFKNIFPPLDLELFFNSIDEQTDLKIEGENMKKMYKQYENDRDYIIIPEYYYGSSDFIIMSYEEGIKFSELESTDYIKHNVILTLSLFMRSMTLINGSVHCDLHCANWKIRKIENTERESYKLVIYDFGIVIHPPLNFMKEFMIAWEICDYDKISNSLDAFIKYHPYDREGISSRKEILKNELKKWTLKPLKMNTILTVLCRWACKYNIVFNGNFLNQAIVMTLVEDEMRKNGITGLNKDEDFNETKECMLKVEYLNYINFCRTKKIFLSLADYLESILNDLNIEFDSLFHKIEYKLSSKGLNISEKKKVTLDL